MKAHDNTPVEVVGTLAGTTLSATEVSVDSQDAEENNEDVEFDGMVSALDTMAKTFKLGDKTIDYSGVMNAPSVSSAQYSTTRWATWAKVRRRLSSPSKLTTWLSG